MNTTSRSRGTRKRAPANRPKEPARGSSESATSSALRFYESETSLARMVAEFLAEGFEAGSTGIVIAPADQRAEILGELAGRSYDVDALQRSLELVLLDAQAVLSTFMVDGNPDAQKFRDEVYQMIARVRRARPNCTVRMFGQIVDVLWQQGDRPAAIRLELLWNQLAQSEASSLVCGYAIGSFYKDAALRVCGRGSSLVLADNKANQPISTAADSERRRSKRNGRR